MKKFYFTGNDSELCWELKFLLSQAKENGLSEIELIEAIPDKSKDYFFCKWIGDVSESGSCGYKCDGYEPRNGKSGICKHKTFCYEKGGKVTFKIK